jgi:uncharacterized membrane protein
MLIVGPFDCAIISRLHAGGRQLMSHDPKESFSTEGRWGFHLASPGHALFSATLIALGVYGLASGHLAGIWQPVPGILPGREFLVYLCALLALGTGLGLLCRSTAASASRLLFAYLLLWFMFFKAPGIFLSPMSAGAYESGGETAVIVSGAWILYAGFSTKWDHRYLGFATGKSGICLARGFYSLALIAFGISHFAYLKLTASLVPGWLPGPFAWAYFTGSMYIAAGLGILTRVYARLAATLSALQMGLFTVLVWVPMVMAGSAQAFQWSELTISWTLTVSALIVADSYRGRPWLAIGKASAQAGTL